MCSITIVWFAMEILICIITNANYIVREPCFVYIWMTSLYNSIYWQVKQWNCIVFVTSFIYSGLTILIDQFFIDSFIMNTWMIRKWNVLVFFLDLCTYTLHVCLYLWKLHFSCEFVYVYVLCVILHHFYYEQLDDSYMEYFNFFKYVYIYITCSFVPLKIF